jgi:DNA invertase Pin-like site-specific DNA recombinase
MSKSTTFGYARVSTAEQNEGRQLEKFKKLGIDERYIFIDHQSGKDFDRPRYKMLKDDRLLAGDTLYIDSIDRLGRNYKEIQKEWYDLTQVIGIDIVVLEMDLLDTRRHKDLIGTFVSDMILQILSYVAEQERVKINTRQAEGIALALKNGIKFGRQLTQIPEGFPEVYDNWQRGEITAITAMQQLNLHKTTFYRLVREYESKQNIPKRRINPCATVKAPARKTVIPA